MRVRDKDGNAQYFTTRPPATDEQIAQAEARLGCPLPPLLRRLYREVGNGGFGPGFGLLSLPTTSTPSDGLHTDGDDFEDFDAVRTYELCRKEKSGPPWPAGVLVICFWGCGIGSLLDCTKPEAMVIREDPNWTREEALERLPEDRIIGLSHAFEAGCWLESHSLEQWFRDWLDEAPTFFLPFDPQPDNSGMSDAQIYASREFQDEEESFPDGEYDFSASERDSAWLHSQV